MRWKSPVGLAIARQEKINKIVNLNEEKKSESATLVPNDYYWECDWIMIEDNMDMKQGATINHFIS